MDVKLVMFKRDGRRRDFRIHKETTVIGRGEDCSLRIPLLSVSRQHCEMLLGGDQVRVRDLASSNGTYVNNQRVNEQPLKAGDRLSIGPVVFTLQIDGVPEQITPVKSKAQKAGQTEAREGAEEEVVDLQADAIELAPAEADESDPIAALEALAEESRKQKKKE